METTCSSKQIQGLVKERNEYRRLLQQSLYAFNVLRNQRISESLNDTTYALAAKIEQAFRRFDEGESDE